MSLSDLFDTPHKRDQEEQEKDELVSLVFGPKPSGPSTRELQYAKARWLSAKREFFALVEEPGLADEEYRVYKMGDPLAWENVRRDIYVAFPDAEIPRWRISLNTVKQAPHLVIFHYQRDLIESGKYVENLHPMTKNYRDLAQRNEENKP